MGLLLLSLVVILTIILLVLKTGGDLEVERELDREKQIRELKNMLIQQDDKLDQILFKIK